MLNQSQIQAYLDLLGFAGLPQVDLASLTALQRAHLGAVPFENLHVFHQVPVRVDLEWSVPKVLDGRGGWCFEVNGAFGALLSGIGFDVDYVGAKVLLAEEHPLETHLGLTVHLDQDYLVDVGFGASVTRPVPMSSSDLITEEQGDYRLRLESQDDPTTQAYMLEFREPGQPLWATQYRLTDKPRQLADFVAGSTFLQEKQDGHFRLKPFATRLIPGGRVTLLTDRIKVRRFGQETETPVAEADWEATLQQWFGMGLPE